MKRLIASFALLVPLAAAQAIPVRLPTTTLPPPPPKVQQVDLTGTTWKGELFGPNVFITFEAGGTLSYRRGAQGLNRPPDASGTWVLDGTTLYFEVNNKASEHRGTVLGNVMSGQSTNMLQGLRAEFRLERLK